MEVGKAIILIFIIVIAVAVGLFGYNVTQYYTQKPIISLSGEAVLRCSAGTCTADFALENSGMGSADISDLRLNFGSVEATVTCYSDLDYTNQVDTIGPQKIVYCRATLTAPDDNIAVLKSPQGNVLRIAFIRS